MKSCLSSLNKKVSLTLLKKDRKDFTWFRVSLATDEKCYLLFSSMKQEEELQPIPWMCRFLFGQTLCRPTAPIGRAIKHVVISFLFYSVV